MIFDKQHGFWAVFGREINHMISHSMFIFLLIIIPIFCFLLFSTLMPDGQPKHLTIGVVDMDNSVVSRNMIRQIDATMTNDVQRFTLYREARNYMQQGRIYGYIVIPANFERDVSFGRQPKIGFYYNAAYYTASSMTQRNVVTMLATLTAAVNLTSRQAHGQSEADAMAQIQPIVPDVHPIGNPEMNYAVYLVNLLIPGIMELLILLTTCYAIGIELKNRTSRKWLSLVDDDMLKALLAKLLPYFLVFSILSMLYLTIMFYYLHFPLNASFGWMVLDAMLLVFASQAMAVFFIGLMPVLRDSLSICSLYGVLGFSFSGFTFPIEGMVSWIQGLSFIFPIRYYFRIYQRMALNGCDWYYEWISFAALLCFLFLPFITMRRLKNACIQMNYRRD